MLSRRALRTTIDSGCRRVRWCRACSGDKISAHRGQRNQDNLTSRSPPSARPVGHGTRRGMRRQVRGSAGEGERKPCHYSFRACL